MLPIPVFFGMVERSALVLRPKQPFLEWLISIDPTNKDIFEKDESFVYLVPDCEESEQIEKWLKKNYDLLFCDRMNYWYTLESMWVQNRNFKMFKQWFDYSIFTTVYDTQRKPISKL